MNGQDWFYDMLVYRFDEITGEQVQCVYLKTVVQLFSSKIYYGSIRGCDRWGVNCGSAEEVKMVRLLVRDGMSSKKRMSGHKRSTFCNFEMSTMRSFVDGW